MSKAWKFLKKIFERKSSEDYEEIWEMANLPPSKTGLTKFVYISGIQGQHGPRVKLSAQADRYDRQNNVPITVESNPRIPKGVAIPKEITADDINQTIRWILLNREVLMLMWRDDADTSALLPLLKKLD